MKKNLNLLFKFTFLAIVFISCEKDDEISNETQTEKSIQGFTSNNTSENIIFQPNAIFVKSDINSQFVSYNTDGTLIFNNNESLNIIDVGDVIYSLPNSNFPDGYALKILSQTNINGRSSNNSNSSKISYTTQPASLTEVFKEYSCVSSSVINTNEQPVKFDFLTEQQQGDYLLNSTPFGAVSSLVPNFEMKNILDTYKTKHFTNPNNNTRLKIITLGSNKTKLEYILYDADNNYGTPNDQVILEMELDYELSNTEINLQNTNFSFKGKHKWSSKATIKYEYENDWTAQQKLEFKNKFNGTVVGKKYNILSIPLTLPNVTNLLIKPNLDIFYELQLDLNGNIKIAAGVKDYEYNFNINNQSQANFTLINQGQYFSDIEIASQLNIGMRFGIGVTAELPAFKLFNLNTQNKKSYLGIYADFGANSNINVSILNQANNTTCFNFSTNYVADAGIYLEYKLFFINDFNLQDKIPIYTSPSFTGSLSDYTKCINNIWLPPVTLKDNNNYTYNTTNINGKWWSSENWRDGSILYNNNLIYGAYIQGDATNVSVNTQSTPGWHLPSSSEYQSLLTALGNNAYNILTQQQGFNAKPYGLMGYYSGNGSNFNISGFNTISYFLTSTKTYGCSGCGVTYTDVLVIDHINQSVSIQNLPAYVIGGMYVTINAYNVRLVKD